MRRNPEVIRRSFESRSAIDRHRTGSADARNADRRLLECITRNCLAKVTYRHSDLKAEHKGFTTVRVLRSSVSVVASNTE